MRVYTLLMEMYIHWAFGGNDWALSKHKLLRTSKFFYRNLSCRNTQYARVHLRGSKDVTAAMSIAEKLEAYAHVWLEEMGLAYSVGHIIPVKMVKTEMALHVLTWKDECNIFLRKKSMISFLLRNYIVLCHLTMGYVLRNAWLGDFVVRTSLTQT